VSYSSRGFGNEAVLLANPRARGVKVRSVARVVRALGLDEDAVRVIGRDGTALDLAAGAVRDGLPYVLVAGGDGTAHDVVQVLAGTSTALAGTSTALGLVPLGTSNDMAARLELPARLEAACGALRRRTVTPVNLIRIGGTRVATVGGFGLAAEVARRCNERRRGAAGGILSSLVGRSIYSLCAAGSALFRFPGTTALEMETDGGVSLRLEASALLAGVTHRFGGGIRLPPCEAGRTGRFALLAVTAATPRQFLQTLAALRFGITPVPYAVAVPVVSSCRVRPANPGAAFADGEWLGYREETLIRIEPSALRVLVGNRRSRSVDCPDRLLPLTDGALSSVPVSEAEREWRRVS
jgi:diacylglycerol kinase (ATP)